MTISVFSNSADDIYEVSRFKELYSKTLDNVIHSEECGKFKEVINVMSDNLDIVTDKCKKLVDEIYTCIEHGKSINEKLNNIQIQDGWVTEFIKLNNEKMSCIVELETAIRNLRMFNEIIEASYL